jgi:pilus assembly protein CpaF
MNPKDPRDASGLHGLFSTRELGQSGTNPAFGSSGVTSAVEDPRAKSGTAQQASDVHRTSLSAIANAVMRESRRELGNNQDLEQGANREVSEEQIAQAVDRVCGLRKIVLDDIARADIIVHLKRDLLGWGVLQPLIDNPEVTDIQCYDYRTVVLQRGKMSETTGLSWPSHDAYKTFVDRLLFRLGKSLSTQQHTVDASFPDGKRICAVHESVCGSRGPLLTIRVPRIAEASLESLVSFQVAPPLIVNYLAALVRTVEHTFIVAGETGTGKTTLMRCLGTQFKYDESIVGVEDTPELNYQHPYYRSLVSRSANTEGVGEVTLQEHIKTCLRLCPTRIILGEMRSPEAAESFLESAQTGHSGMSTIHARNSRETLTRLESLLGRAQRGVSMDIIRQQIALAVDVVVWQCRERTTGRVRCAEVMEVGHFVEGNIQVRPMFKLVKQGENPMWEVLSYSSFYESVLEQNGIYLGDAPKFIGFSSNSNLPAATDERR